MWEDIKNKNGLDRRENASVSGDLGLRPGGLVARERYSRLLAGFAREALEAFRKSSRNSIGSILSVSDSTYH
jgi:hypothetical protein